MEAARATETNQLHLGNKGGDNMQNFYSKPSILVVFWSLNVINQSLFSMVS